MKKTIFSSVFLAAFLAGASSSSGDLFEKSVHANTGEKSGFKREAHEQRDRHRDDGSRHRRHGDGDGRRGDSDKRDRRDGRNDGDGRRGPDRQGDRPSSPQGGRSSGGPRDWDRWSGHHGWHHERPWAWNPGGYWIWGGWAGATVWYSSNHEACRDYYSSYRNSCSLTCDQTQQNCLRDCRIFASDEAYCTTTCNNHVAYCYSGCTSECNTRIDACWRH